MSGTAWYRSLYWRIGIGFVLFLAFVVAVQAAVLVWLTSRVEYGPPSPSATRVVAEELAAALKSDPKLDIAQFFRQHYEERMPMIAIMRDGRVVASNGVQPADDVLAEARTRFNSGLQAFGPPRGFGPGGPGGPGSDGRPRFGPPDPFR